MYEYLRGTHSKEARRIVLLDFHRVSDSCSRTRETRSAPLFIGSGLDHENFRVNRPPIRYARVTRAKSSLLIRVSMRRAMHGEERRGERERERALCPFSSRIKESLACTLNLRRGRVRAVNRRDILRGLINDRVI